MKKENEGQEEVLPIDHSKIMDGLGYLVRYKNYQSYESYCGICDKKTLVTASTQKYLLEIKKVPVKMLRRGAIYCQSCAKRRAQINWLRKGNKFLEIENGKTDLESLVIEENELKKNSQNPFDSAVWKY